MTADGNRLPKYARVAAAVRGQIADGTLRPGQPAPSGAALSRITGFSTLTCRRALRALVADGILTPGPSRNARPRVAGPSQLPAERDLAAAARALSAGLAARRRAIGLTQPELARRVGVSVTTIGHAETGRLWQSREFWAHADALLSAGGGLLTLHDAYREASASSSAGAPEAVAATWRAGAASGGRADDDATGAPRRNGQAAEPCACLTGGHRDGAAAVPGQPTPACVMIMWGDGTVTTVRPPDTALADTPPGAVPPGAAPPGAAFPG
jgi:DNA-binding transcriptional regulator YhcF (GntR family)